MARVGQLIRTSRSEAGLSQVELAVKAGTSQPTLARYETGAALPTLPTLERLLRACGRELRIEAAPLGEGTGRASSVRGQLGEPAEKLRHHRGALLDAARRHGVRKLRVFGSVARGESNQASDVDLLVELQPERTLVDLAGFRREAAEILDLAVDVATADMLKEHVRVKALADALPL